MAGLDLDGNPEIAGHLRHFDEALASALHVAEALLQSPDCLAALLAAAGKVTLERVGSLLDDRVPAGLRPPDFCIPERGPGDSRPPFGPGGPSTSG